MVSISILSALFAFSALSVYIDPTPPPTWSPNGFHYKDKPLDITSIHLYFRSTPSATTRSLSDYTLHSDISFVLDPYGNQGIAYFIYSCLPSSIDSSKEYAIVFKQGTKPVFLKPFYFDDPLPYSMRRYQMIATTLDNIEKKAVSKA